MGECPRIIKRHDEHEYQKRKLKEKEELEKFMEKQEELDFRLKKQQQKHLFKSILSKLRFESYTKTLVAIVVFVGLVDLQLSYILAFFGKEQIAENLSIQVCITILGTVLMYIIRAYFDDNKTEKEDKDDNKLLKDKLEDIGFKVINDAILHATPENPDDDYHEELDNKDNT